MTRNAQREPEAPTRPACPQLDRLLGVAHPVLDHGFVRVIDYMGNDASIVQAARVSYGTGTKSSRQDRGLIRYLMRHRHTTPFEMCEIKLHVKLPIFVARQWIRHRTANVNEYSARYSILDREFYVPDPGHLAAQSKENKQGRGEPLSAAEAEDVREEIRRHSTEAYGLYERLLNADAEGNAVDEGRPGIARELARTVLPVNFYTQWYWKIDLHNLLHFLALRADPHAQAEIRAYAETIGGIVRQWVPLTWEAFQDYRTGAATVSAQEIELIKRMSRGERVSPQDSGLSKREWEEFAARFEV